MRNTWPATIAGLTLLTDRVRLDLAGGAVRPGGRDPGSRRRARARLPGSQVWLSAKATELEVYGHADPADQGKGH